MATKRITALTEETSPATSEFVMTDGTATRKVTIANLIGAARPFATQSEAETGSGTTQSMNPLTTKQAHDYRLTQAETITGVKTFTPSSLTAQSAIVKATDNGASAGPFTDNVRVSSSPATADILGAFRVRGMDSAGNELSYAQFRAVILDPTDGSEDGQAQIVVALAATQTVAASWAPGYIGGGATGGSRGLGTVNATGFYLNGANIVAHFDTVTAAAASTPTVAPNYIRTAGYSTVGIGGALYKLAASEPSHPGKFSLTLADGVTVKWFELLGDESGQVTPEMFGATRGKSTLSTTALSNLTTFVNATGMPIRLDYFYRTAATMTFTVDGLVITGTTGRTSGICFEGCHGINLDHDGLSTFARFKIQNIGLLTDSATLYRAIDGIGVANTGGADSYREISGCLFAGEGLFDLNGDVVPGSPPSTRNGGWLDAIRLNEMDNVNIFNIRIFAAWQQFLNNNSVSAIKFEIDTAGVRLIGCTGSTIENVKVFYARHGAHISGQCEGVNLIRNIFFPCWNGITFVDLVNAANYHQIVGNHVSAFNRGISFAEGQTGHGSVMNRISDNLIFMYPGNTYASYDFRHIVVSCARSEIRSNYLYIAPGDSAATYCPTGMEIQAAANQITHNQFDGLNVFITFGASGQNSLVAFNQSFASEGVGSVDPVVDGGAGNTYTGNFGDKLADWP